MEHLGAMPRIFISYSHNDKAWKDRVVSQLGVLEHEGLLSVWEDRQIAGGDEWLPAIETAMASCSVALLLISAAFLTSKFILGVEVPRLLQRREREGVRVIPVILKPCAWTRVPWLKSIQARPKDGKPLSGMSEYDADAAITALAEEIADLLARRRDKLFFQQQEAITADPAHKFALKKQIEEAQAKICEAASSALEIWRDKLDFFQQQEAITADPAQKFALKKQIEEAQAKIRELAQLPDNPALSKESIRLDVAHPEQAFVNEAFVLAVAVRQPDALPLKIDDLPISESAPGKVYRPQAEDVIRYRIEVTGPDCEVSPSHYSILLRRGENAEPRFFQVTCHLEGIRTIFVNAYQEDDALAAQTRTLIKIMIRVHNPKKRLLIIGCVCVTIVLFICYILPCKKACDDNDLDSICKEMDNINKLVEVNNWKDAADSLKNNAEKIVNCGYPKTSDYKNAFTHYKAELFQDSVLTFQAYFNDMKLHQGLCK